MAVKKHTERAHALLSASGSSRWINCPPSARLEDKVDEKDDSDFAKEGTLAHEISELKILRSLKKLDKKDYDKKYDVLRKNKLFQKEMAGYTDDYHNYVIEKYNIAISKSIASVLLIEEKVEFTNYVPEGFGSCDANIICDDHLEIIDLKYGKGIKVEVESNSQFMLYALGAINEYDFLYDINTITMTVAQPRLDHYESWTISKKELFEWAGRILAPAAKMAYEGKGLQCAGSWCKFCRIKPQCATLANEAYKVARDEFTDPRLLKEDQIVEVYSKAAMIAGYLKALAAYMLDEAMKGKSWPGYKLVRGRSNRKFTDEGTVQDKLSVIYSEDQYINKELKGLGDLEKLLGKKNFGVVLGSLITKPQGAPTLAPMSDKRQAINSAEDAKNDFTDFNNI